MPYRSKVFYTGTGSEQVLSVTFPYLDITHIHIRFDEVVQEDNTWSWVTGSTIALTAISGAIVEIFRSTPYEPMVTFTNSSLLNEDDQNMAALQAIYLIEELLDGQTILEDIVHDFNLTDNTFAITFIADGVVTALGTGIKGFLQIPFDCTILEAHVYADTAGSMVIDIWKDTFANFPPTDAASITSETPLTLVGNDKVKNLSLTAWIKDITAGDILAYNIDSCDTIQRVTITLVVQK